MIRILLIGLLALLAGVPAFASAWQQYRQPAGDAGYRSGGIDSTTWLIMPNSDAGANAGR
jgi:hypothetical protein